MPNTPLTLIRTPLTQAALILAVHAWVPEGAPQDLVLLMAAPLLARPGGRTGSRQSLAAPAPSVPSCAQGENGAGR
ncbi:hypothetical protein ACFVH6_30065 [Spirillospora sp. NPDC127200]